MPKITVEDLQEAIKEFVDPYPDVSQSRSGRFPIPCVSPPLPPCISGFPPPFPAKPPADNRSNRVFPAAEHLDTGLRTP